MKPSLTQQVRKLRWSVAFVILENCDLIISLVFQGSVCCEAATDQKGYLTFVCFPTWPSILCWI